MGQIIAQPPPIAAPRRALLRGPSDWSEGTLMGVLILSAALPYANTLFNGLVYDDTTQVLSNPYIRNFRHLGEILSTNVWSFVGMQGATNYYRPLMTLGYLLCYQLFGPLAYGFHLANIVLDAAVVCVLFRVTERMFRDRALGFVAAAAFALHPVHTESVAWVAAVTDLELTFFYLLTFWFFLKVAQAGSGRSDQAELAMLGSFVLAILSKEQALTLPLLATFYEHLYRDDRARTSWRQKLFRYLWLWLLSAAYLLFRIRIFGAVAPVLQIPSLTLYQAVLSGIALVGQYLGKLLWPAHLCAFYVFRKSVSLTDPRVIAGLAALTLCAALFVVLWRRCRLASFGLVWLLVTLAPVLNARWMAANVFTERYLYLPSAGFCWLLAWAGVGLRARASAYGVFWRRALVVALSLIAALCVVRIVTRNRDWHDDLVLFTRTLAASPRAGVIWNNLGVVYWGHGDFNAAEQAWREATKLSPKNAIFLSNLGLAYTKRKDYAAAVEIFRRAMRLKPSYTDPHLNLGVAEAEMGLREAAELQLRAAVAVAPLNVRARNELGKFYFGAGRFREAEEQFRKSVESEPNGEAYNRLGDIYLRWEECERAERVFGQAASLNSFDSHAHFNLGMLYAARGETREAAREYQAGLETDPNNLEARAALQELKPQVLVASHSRP